MKNITFSLLSVVAVFGIIAVAVLDTNAQNAKGFHLLNKIEVGGEGGWDILIADAKNNRLYVSHGTHAVVIDTATDKVVGDIPKTNGIHGIAFSSKYGFTTNGRDNSVTMFELDSLKVTNTIPTGKNPDALVYDKATDRVFVFTPGSSDCTVIDATSGKAVGTIALPGKPEFAVTDGKGKVYVNLEDKSSITEIDSRNMKVLNTWSLAPAEGPTGLAIDPKTHRLFAACDGKMVAVDANTGKVVATIPTGPGADGMEFDPELKYVFSPNGGDGTMTVIHEDSPDKYSIVENVKTQVRARTMAIDTKTHKVYLPIAQFGAAATATKDIPRPRPPMVPNSFAILVYGK